MKSLEIVLITLNLISWRTGKKEQCIKSRVKWERNVAPVAPAGREF